MSQITKLSFEEALKQNPQLKESDIQSLREWCEKEPHLPKICDNSLALFLHKNYYHIESTKRNIENYYTMRTKNPDAFSGRDTLHCKSLRHIFNIMAIVRLQEVTKAGYNIIFVKFIDADASKFRNIDYSRYILTVLDLAVYCSGFVDGYVIIFDIQDVTLGHAARFSPSIMKKHLSYMGEGIPARLKELHFVHVNRGMEAIMNMSRPLATESFQKIWHLHNSLKSLEKFVSIEVLPNEAGGKAGPLLEIHNAEIKELEKHRDWFLEEESRSRVDETKRLGKIASDEEDNFGADGSFKKLDDN